MVYSQQLWDQDVTQVVRRCERQLPETGTVWPQSPGPVGTCVHHMASAVPDCMGVARIVHEFRTI